MYYKALAFLSGFIVYKNDIRLCQFCMYGAKILSVM